jgi:hypothetical protein
METKMVLGFTVGLSVNGSVFFLSQIGASRLSKLQVIPFRCNKQSEFQVFFIGNDVERGSDYVANLKYRILDFYLLFFCTSESCQHSRLR